jgi:hypothetical protein
MAYPASFRVKDGQPVPCQEYQGCVHDPAGVGSSCSICETFHRLESDSPNFVGIGGAPSRATILPENAKERKKYPIASGFMDYFPDAIAAVSNVSWIGNDQHNPGKPVHWDRSKSGDEADTMLRHFLQRGTLDKDGVRHSAKLVWRALALLQKEIEAEQK